MSAVWSVLVGGRALAEAVLGGHELGGYGGQPVPLAGESRF